MLLDFQLNGYVPGLKDYFLVISLIINIIFGIIFYRKYYFNVTALIRIRIKKHKTDFPEYRVQVKNKGLIPVEIDPPVIIFKKKGIKRVFQVRNGQTSFPLALFKKEEYEFIVDLARFYNGDSSLITFKKVYIEIRDKNQKKLKRKKMIR